MSWPWMRRRTFIREVTRVAQAYRWERDQVLAKEAELDRRLEMLVQAWPLRDRYPASRLRVIVECDDLLNRYGPTDEEYRRLAERIIRALVGMSRDYRADLRECASLENEPKLGRLL